MRHLNRGQLLKAEELTEITQHLYISQHAIMRMRERGLDMTDINNIILNPYMAYFNTDYSINIAKDKFNYLVVVAEGNGYKIVTYKEQSHNGITIGQKRTMAINGYGRG